MDGRSRHPAAQRLDAKLQLRLPAPWLAALDRVVEERAARDPAANRQTVVRGSLYKLIATYL